VEQRRENMRLFHSKSQLPGIIGAVDCTHVPIQSPGSDDAEIYRNRKGYMSINVQLVCDCNNYISDVVARWAVGWSIKLNGTLSTKYRVGQKK